MVRPDYNNSIVNLMSSLTQGRGEIDAGDNPYLPLADLPPAEIENAHHVVLLVADGLGYNYVQTHGTLLKSALRTQLTSVFPSTTAAAISSILTGRAPQQHTVTGWFMNLKELGTMAALLPFRARWGGESSFADAGVKVSDLMATDNVFDRMTTSTYFVIDEDLIDTPYSIANAGRAQRIGYVYRGQRNFALCLDTINQLITQTQSQSGEKSFIYAYWPLFDSLAHDCGTNHSETYQHFQEIEAELDKLFDRLQGTNTLFIVISDHGLIDCEPQTTVYLNDHPRLRSYLNLPLGGEPRAAYCYVRNDSVDAFLNYVQRHLADYFDCYPSRQLIAEGWFGLGEPAPRLAERVGDYILLSKGQSVIVDRMLTENPWSLIGVHGGTHPDEMYVPLISVTC